MATIKQTPAGSPSTTFPSKTCISAPHILRGLQSPHESCVWVKHAPACSVLHTKHVHCTHSALQGHEAQLTASLLPSSPRRKSRMAWNAQTSISVSGAKWEFKSNGGVGGHQWPRAPGMLAKNIQVDSKTSQHTSIRLQSRVYREAQAPLTHSSVVEGPFEGAGRRSCLRQSIHAGRWTCGLFIGHLPLAPTL